MFSMRVRPGQRSADELLVDYALAEQTLGELNPNDRGKAALALDRSDLDVDDLEG
jgi:hypothetical protein